jgi:hypothetical protein
VVRAIVTSVQKGLPKGFWSQTNPGWQNLAAGEIELTLPRDFRRNSALAASVVCPLDGVDRDRPWAGEIELANGTLSSKVTYLTEKSTTASYIKRMADDDFRVVAMALAQAGLLVGRRS